MPTKKTGANNTSQTHTSEEIKEWFYSNKENIENFVKSQDVIHTLRDITKSYTNKTISTINKEELKQYIKNIAGNEKKLRDIARYLYYRSNIFFRLVNWYADMWDLHCRKVVPNYNLIKDNDPKRYMKSFEDTLNLLDKMNLQGNMVEILLNVYVQDVCYAITFLDDTGMFFYILDPDECMIDTRYSTGDFGFAINMSKWRTASKQKIIEFLGSPLKEMYAEYERTNQRFIHCPDEYAACFKFRVDTWDTAIPPFLPLFIQIAGLEDLVDIQAEADALSIYKLIYMPMKVHRDSKSVDDFEINPQTAYNYFRKLMNDAIPENVGAAMVPGEELKTIDFSKNVDSDINSVEKASNQILQTAGGGAVINANNITSTAAFNAWLKAETEFALSTLMPQVNGFANRMLKLRLTNPAKVEHFEVSVYTKETLAEQLLTSCQYSFANRLAYNTLLGISEKDTLAMMYLENDILGLQNKMIYPLQSSYTQSNNEGGRPTKDDGELSNSGDRMRNQ